MTFLLYPLETNIADRPYRFSELDVARRTGQADRDNNKDKDCEHKEELEQAEPAVAHNHHLGR